MDLAASACIIVLTVSSILLPSVRASRVLGTKISRDTSVNLSIAAVDVDNSDDVDFPRSDAMQETKDARKAAIEAAREEFREKLAEIRNVQKRRILERIGDRLDQINDRWTTHFDNVLSRLGEILAKIGTRADKLEGDGQDVALVRQAITDAETAIALAQGVVDSQAENSYVIDITDEASLKDDFKAVRDILHSDLTATRDEVRTARQTVHDAFQVLRSVHNNQDVEEGGVDEE